MTQTFKLTEQGSQELHKIVHRFVLDLKNQMEIQSIDVAMFTFTVKRDPPEVEIQHRLRKVQEQSYKYRGDEIGLGGQTNA